MGAVVRPNCGILTARQRSLDISHTVTSYEERRGGIRVSHWESDIWSTEFREHLFVLGPTKDRISRQVTWQRAPENKEKCNKTTQCDAMQLWEGMSLRVHLNRVARARGRGRDIVKRNRSEDEWSLLFRQQGVQTHFASLCTLCCSFLTLTAFVMMTHLTAVFPKGLQAVRSKGWAYLIHTIHPAPNNP